MSWKTKLNDIVVAKKNKDINTLNLLADDKDYIVAYRANKGLINVCDVKLNELDINNPNYSNQKSSLEAEKIFYINKYNNFMQNAINSYLSNSPTPIKCNTQCATVTFKIENLQEGESILTTIHFKNLKNNSDPTIAEFIFPYKSDPQSSNISYKPDINNSAYVVSKGQTGDIVPVKVKLPVYYEHQLKSLAVKVLQKELQNLMTNPYINNNGVRVTKVIEPVAQKDNNISNTDKARVVKEIKPVTNNDNSQQKDNSQTDILNNQTDGVDDKTENKSASNNMKAAINNIKGNTDDDSGNGDTGAPPQKEKTLAEDMKNAQEKVSEKSKQARLREADEILKKAQKEKDDGLGLW